MAFVWNGFKALIPNVSDINTAPNLLVPCNIFKNKREFTQSWKTAFYWSVSTNGSGSSFQQTLVGQERVANP